MQLKNITKPWVSFCMSTYKRPVLLKQQLELILLQTDTNFEIVISDNDPDCSGRDVVNLIDDSRIKYFANEDNLGMISSFNKSIIRANTEFVIMITDDDPVEPNMLHDFFSIINAYPNFGIYIGCERNKKHEKEIEVFDRDNFLYQVLHPKKTSNILWSSCIMKREVLLNIGGMPNYGSPHLADHVMIALCGCDNGGVIINKMYSQLTAHDNNFSKGNLQLYLTACKGFYNLISSTVSKNIYVKKGQNSLLKHLERWFLVGMFSLKNYYTYKKYDEKMLQEIDDISYEILALDYMKPIRFSFYRKLLIFNLKKIYK